MSAIRNSSIRIKAPGRLCLLGEHQDYLGLEVISGALNLSVTIDAVRQPNKKILDVELVQTGEYRGFDPAVPRRPAARDYLQSGLNEMLERGAQFAHGWRIRIDGDLPIGKGVSSSSALCVAWIKLLGAISVDPEDIPPLDVARLAHRIEVKRFHEPGGMQDHIASACGGLLHMNFQDNPDSLPVITRLDPVPAGFLLVDSGQPKETLGMISRIKRAVERQLQELDDPVPVSLSRLSISNLPRMPGDNDPFAELRATLDNRDLTRRAFDAWPAASDAFPQFLPPLIREHHSHLTRGIGSSSPAIDQCIELCMQWGAAAGKVIGSGGGGCLLVYDPGDTDRLIARLRERGYRAWRVCFSTGVSIM
ncbi:hypothetical protein JW823_05885 [bacterium]|nr:hypothetical protein [candidate division CSSED10-310 bacterium]